MPTKTPLKLYKIILSPLNAVEYDEYDSVIITAKSPADAMKFHPDGRKLLDFTYWPEGTTIEFIGTAKAGAKEGVILASFNAG